MRPAAILLALLVVAAALAPVALADHAYSHRYIIYGRVVDASGFPLQGMTVRTDIQGQTVEGPCAASHPPVTQQVTDSDGDFFWCYHTHRIEARGGTWKAWVDGYENATVGGDLDRNLRKSAAYITLPANVAANRGPDFSKSYRVWVTLWRPGDQGVEGISVEGLALTNRNVTATLLYNDGKEASKFAHTNDYGDVVFEFSVGENITSGKVRIDAPRGESRTADLDLRHHASTVVVVYPGDPWYERIPGFGTWAILAALAGTALALAARRRR